MFIPCGIVVRVMRDSNGKCDGGNAYFSVKYQLVWEFCGGSDAMEQIEPMVLYFRPMNRPHYFSFNSFAFPFNRINKLLHKYTHIHFKLEAIFLSLRLYDATKVHCVLMTQFGTLYHKITTEKKTEFIRFRPPFLQRIYNVFTTTVVIYYLNLDNNILFISFYSSNIVVRSILHSEKNHICFLDFDSKKYC